MQVCIDLIVVCLCSLFEVLLSISICLLYWPFSHAVEGEDFVFDGIVQLIYRQCASVQDCVLVDCIDIELLDDMDVEGIQKFEVEIVSVTLGSIGAPETTEVVINDTIGG